MSILRSVVLAVLGAGISGIIGCSSGPSVTLDQIQPKRVFTLGKEKTFDAVRFFTLKEGFIVDSAEDETGRFFAHRVITERGGRTGRMIVMNVKITSVDATHTEVLARFTYAQASTSQTREEEGILVDFYLTLFNTLESAAE